MTVVSASLVAMFIAKYGSLNQALGMILLTFLISGLFQIVFGLIKLGQYIRYIPYPVLSGFMSSIGIIIIALQLYPLMGLSSPQIVLEVFVKLPAAISHVNVYSILLSGITIALVYLLPLIKRELPATLIALVLVSVINYFAGFDVKLIGESSAGLPALQWEAFLGIKLSDLLIVIGPALTLAGLGTLDTLLTSIVAGNVTHTKHKSNRELIGQGIGNGVGALFGALPGAGATMRTLVI